VSRGHLSRRKDPEILEIVARISGLRASRNPSADEKVALPGHAPSEAPPSGHAHLTDEALQVVIRRDLAEVARLQQMWLGRHGRGSSTTDAALALYDADQLLMRLRAAVERVRPAVGEWNHRRGLLLKERTSASQGEYEPGGAALAPLSPPRACCMQERSHRTHPETQVWANSRRAQFTSREGLVSHHFPIAFKS
jgi:hypothetical protein